MTLSDDELRMYLGDLEAITKNALAAADAVSSDLEGVYYNILRTRRIISWIKNELDARSE